MKRPYTYIGIALLLLVVIALALYTHTRPAHAPTVTASTSYLCRDGKTIDASFGESSVTLTLSDTRALILPQTISGSGIRYEKDGIAFVSKGDNAFLDENGTQTFVDCVATGSPAATSATDAGGTKQFRDSAGTFSFTYPSTVTVSGGGVGYTQGWMVNATSSGIIFAKAILSKSFQPNTNFSDATLTIGTSADPSSVATCLSYNPSGGPAVPARTETINGVQYTVLHSNDAGAGNRYDTTSYRTLRNNQCYALEYTIHSSTIGNYSPDQGIKEFDNAAVMGVMEAVVHSFHFSDGA